MAMEVEEAFPSFSTERIRSKLHVRDGPVAQRRLDYNAPLLSVRRLADAGGDLKSKVWKLSAELSKEPLRIPGAVPFTWEHSPGRPKQPESPPRAPSSPSPPSTPSPPSVRRASPASPPLPPPPPPLRPLFLRSNSSTLFAPPPPPPPPPPPLPRKHPLPVITRRSAPHVERSHSSSSYPPLPPPPPPPPPPTTTSHLPTQVSRDPALRHLPDHGRIGAFRLVDPTEGFLRVLRARREKSEPQEFLATEAGETVGLAEVAVEMSKVSSNHGLLYDGCAEVTSINGNSSCVVVDAIVQRFLKDHPDAAAEEATSAKAQDDDEKREDSQATLDAVISIELPCVGSNDDAARQGEDVIARAIDPCTIIPWKEDSGYVSVTQVVRSYETAEGTIKGESTVGDCTSTPTWENTEPENGESKLAICAAASPSTDPLEVPLEAGREQSLVKKQQSKRCTSSITILDSCRVESLRMIKSALVQLCRKAAAASLRTLGKAKRKVTLSRRTSSSLEVVVHRNTNKALDCGGSDHEEEAVVSEVKAILQNRLSQEAQQQQSLVSLPHSPPISPPKSSPSVQESTESALHNEINTVAKKSTPTKKSTPISPPQSSTGLQASIESTPCSDTNNEVKMDIVSSDVVSSSLHFGLRWHGSPDLQPAKQQETQEIRSTTNSARHLYAKSLGCNEPNAFSAHHVYAKSLGGDETNEFFDASSRFGSQSSTPSRIILNRSISKDWVDDFLDATSTPFETPRASVSDSKYAMSDTECAPHSPSMALKMGSSTRPTSKLSKRVGKALWVETKEINAAGKVDAISSNGFKGFFSGELCTTTNESLLVLNKKEINASRRKYVSGDQASTSTSAETRTRQHKRGGSRSTNGRSSSQVMAVTPVFPSKCQKNRSVGSASGLPHHMSTGNMAEMGWPLGISGYPPLKACTKGKEERKREGGKQSGGMVPSPPLPPSPAGGSWLRKALSSHPPSRLAGLHAMASPSKKLPPPNSPGNKWEDIVKGSHVQPGHLRFSEELHHHPPSSSNSNKYYVS